MSLRTLPTSFSRASGLALAAFLAASLGSALPPSPSPAAVPAGPPPGLAPLPPELAKPLPDLAHAAEEYRGLAFRRPVPAGFLSGAALRRQVDRQVAEEMAPGALAALGSALKAFGLIPESLDLPAYYPTLLSSQVAAFYDPERKYLAVVDMGQQGDEAMTRELGAAFAERARQAVLVHELTHALQDQAFDMSRYVSTDPLSDASAARLALVEGDATVTMTDFLLGTKIEAVPGAADLMGSMLKGSGEGAVSGAPGFPGSREIAAAPAWFRDTLLFSYLRGFGFCVAVRQRGGQKLLDYAFAKDPPRSSEQVLHPEKWFGRRDDPIEITLPDLAPLLPGAQKVAEGELGEEGIRVLLASPPSGAGAGKPTAAEASEAAGCVAAAAAGWGGDRFAVYRRGGGRLLAWVTEWDSEADAAEFLAAMGRLGAGWTVRRTAPTRVVVTRGALEPEDAVVAALAAAPAEKPADRPIDLAALGIRPAAAKAPAAVHPPGDGAAPLPHLLGRRYSDPAHGFSVELPEAGGPWRLGARPRPDLPLLATAADGEATLEVRERDLGEPGEGAETGPSETSPRRLGEAMAREIERKGGRVLRAELLAAGPYELESTEEVDGRPVHAQKRLYVQGHRLLEVGGTAPTASWAAHRAEVEAFLGRFELAGAPAGAPAGPPRP